jgi:hypothetical protein
MMEHMPARKLTAFLIVLCLTVLAVTTVAGAAAKPSARFKTPGAPAFPVAYRGFLWVAAHRGGAIYKIDPKTDRIVHTYQTNESACYIQGSGSRIIFYTCDGPGGTVLNIRTGKMRRFGGGPQWSITTRPLGHASYWGNLTYAGSEWIFSPGRVERVDPKSHVVLKRWHGIDGEGSSNVANGSIWIGGTTTVTRVDMSDDKLTIIPLPGALTDPGDNQGYAVLERLAVTPGTIWATNPRGLYRIDMRTNQATQVPAIHVGNLDEWGYIDLVAAAGSLFMRNGPSQVVRIDPISGKITHRYAAAGGGGGIELAYRSLWVTNFIADTTWRIPIG